MSLTIEFKGGGIRYAPICRVPCNGTVQGIRRVPPTFGMAGCIATFYGVTDESKRFL